MSTGIQEERANTDEATAKSSSQFVDLCFVRTAEALNQTGAATENDVHKALASVRESQEKNEPADLLETLARIQGHDEEHIGPAIGNLSDAIASTIHPSPPVIPFASKLIAPSAFYDSFESLHQLGRLLLTPVVYAEDTDAIGTASINPIASIMLGEEILQAVNKRFGIRPFITNARMEYESWAFLCRKHFEL
ncbi:MAG: hypothetical protein AB8D78_09030 [Akkermansiaceae bacterium]